MKIHQDFTGGNIKVWKENGDHIYLENELRDTVEDWFYWAFCAEGAAGRTLTFHLQKNRLGYWGPAVSHDLQNWHWLNACSETEFVYSFGKNENKVYFAHSLLYHPDRFAAFAAAKGLNVREFCKTGKNRSVPAVQIGKGEISICLTARHHACESTGNYVLEGVLDELTAQPIPNAAILCVPFMDLDGVLDGDQGKSRAPHDHNRDYPLSGPSIYAAVQKMREYVEQNGCTYGFDFHSPWHRGGENDVEFIVQNNFEKLERFNAFGKLFEAEITERSFSYHHENDYPFMQGWNQKNANFGAYMSCRPENVIAFGLETPYFGTPENKVSPENLVELGRCFARALKRFIAQQ